LVLPVGGLEDDRRAVRFRDVLHRFDPVNTREHQVEQHQIRPLLLDEAEEVVRVGGGGDCVACLDEGVADVPVPERLVVVGHRQDSHLSSRLELPNESAVYLAYGSNPRP
jgi:hypothetical protein